MTEKEIRNKTNELLDAYRTVAGDDYVPGVKEYLFLRKEAIAELSRNIGSNKSKPVPAAGMKKNPKRPVPEPAAERGTYITDTSTEKKRPPEPESVCVMPEPSTGTTEKGLSEFEILRGIKDSWN